MVEFCQLEKLETKKSILKHQWFAQTLLLEVSMMIREWLLVPLDAFATNSSKLCVMLKKSPKPPFYISAIIGSAHLFINIIDKLISE